MRVVTRTGDYTIYQKRNQRYAVRDRNRQWLRGDAKVAILAAHDLVTEPPKKPSEAPEAAAAESEAAAETPAAPSAEEGAGDAEPEPS